MKRFTPWQVEQLKEIGNYLQQQRENSSLSLAEVASTTFINLSILEALETGEIERLPELIYVRGFIRRYSEILQIDGEALVEKLSSNPEIVGETTPPAALNSLGKSSVESIYLVKTPVAMQQEEATKELSAASPSIKTTPRIIFWGSLVGVAVAICWGGWYFLSRPPEIEQTSQETPTPTVTVSPSIEASLNPPTPAPTTTAPLAATVTLVGDSWLQVKVDGKVEYQGTLTKGETKSWLGQKQLLIHVGNAGAVNLSVNQAAPKLMGSLGEVKKIVLNSHNQQPKN